MNTAKQINIMIGLIFVGLLGTLLYFMFDNGFNAFGIDFEGREHAAQIRQERTNVERGGALYALNCRSCHGLTGQGQLENRGLPGAPLNSDDNRPPKLTEAQVNTRADRLSGTIHCGRVGTLMPPWSIDEDGPLNDFQIEQLVLLITSEFSEEGWEFAVEDANHTDAFDPGKHLAEALSDSATTVQLNDSSTLVADGFLRIGGNTIEEPYEVLRITGVNVDEGTVEVERGVQSTAAMEHEAGAEVYNGPIEPPTEPITGATGTPPCGQGQAVPQATPGPPVDVSGDVVLEMGDNFFSLDGSTNPTMQVAAGDSVTFSLPNNGQNPHNLRIAGADGEYSTDDDFISDPDTITGGEEGTLDFTFSEAGTFLYHCDFHPSDMLGEITILE